MSSPLGMTEGESRPPHARTGGGDAAQEPLTPADRASALAQGSPAIPPNFVFWVLGVILVLSVGGLVGEHVFSFAGLNPTPTSTPTTAARAAPAATPGAPVPATDHSLNAPLAAFMGVSAPSPRAAPPFTLTDQAGLPWSVPAQPPRVVVLTFFDAPCNDICPVLASEIEQADADLGPLAARVEFLTVNTDPTALAQSSDAPVLQRTGLGALSNWRMLTGPLASLDAVWKAYGVSISADTKTGLEAAQRRHGLHRRQGRPALPGDTLRRRERHRNVQPVACCDHPLGPRHGHLHGTARRAVTEPMTAPVAPASPGSSRPPLWQRRRTLVIALVIVVVVLITVLTDLPVPTSRASDVAAERSVMSEVNTDLGPCALAVHQAVGIWKLQAAHQLTPADRAPTPGLLSDDQVACSLTNDGVYDLSGIQVPGTPAGKHLGDMVATTLLWTTSDALRAIEDVQGLMNHPKSTVLLHDLAKEEASLAADRRTAQTQEHGAERSLETQLQPVDLPVVATSSGTG